MSESRRTLILKVEGPPNATPEEMARYLQKITNDIHSGINASKGMGMGWFHEWSVEGGEPGYYRGYYERERLRQSEMCHHVYAEESTVCTKCGS